MTLSCDQSIYGVLCKYASNGCIIITTPDLVHANEVMLRMLGKYCKIYANQYFVELHEINQQMRVTKILRVSKKINLFCSLSRYPYYFIPKIYTCYIYIEI